LDDITAAGGQRLLDFRAGRYLLWVVSPVLAIGLDGAYADSVRESDISEEEAYSEPA
jgi:hypothetical protein